LEPLPRRPAAGNRQEEMRMSEQAGFVARPEAARKFRWAIRTGKRGVEGYATAYGLRIGYWPCLRAPYLQIAFHRWRIEVWHGLPSYRGEDA
jgi:hypothetical protein